MELADFDFSLSPDLIAKYPTRVRRESRLLCLNRKTKQISHHYFFDLPNLLQASDLLVLNDTKVVPARLLGYRSTGGKVSILLERALDDKHFLAIAHANRPLKVNDTFLIEEHRIQLVDRQDELCHFVLLTDLSVVQLFDRYGEIPLPPYLKRQVETEDRERYQTVYAKVDGSCAAPTAGLHFDQTLFKALTLNGINYDYLTLHVGMGTFKPLKEGPLENQSLHAERVEVSEHLVGRITAVKRQKGRVIAVGTTSLRSLETAALSGVLKAYRGESRLFLYPGNACFRVVDGLITNFHLPRTSLLMLVCALAGYDLVMQAYQEAIQKRYRFFSYGDAMLIL